MSSDIAAEHSVDDDDDDDDESIAELNNNNELDDDLADTQSDNEGEEGDAAKAIEPSFENFGSIPFYAICQGLERVWQRKINSKAVKKKPMSQSQKLFSLMPRRLIERHSTPKTAADASTTPRPESIFPLMRLLCPDEDGTRRLNCKEKTLALMYTYALSFDKDSKEAKMLSNYHDPLFVGHTTEITHGDFSLVVEKVLLNGTQNPCDISINPNKKAKKDKKANKKTNPLLERYTARVSMDPSKITVAELNKALDDLACLSIRYRPKTNHDWNRSAGTDEGNKKKNGKKPPALNTLRANWLRQFMNGSPNRLSPMEHKWLVRIILGDGALKLGLGYEAILRWYHRGGPALYSGHNSLKAVCTLLCQPGMRSDQTQAKNDGLHLPTNLTFPPYLSQLATTEVQLGVRFTPMFSERTGFDRLLDGISHRHRDAKVPKNYIDVLEQMKEESKPRYQKALGSMAVMHPAFSIETKLDGERMLIHYHHETQTVKMHTRQGNWYSHMYSPCLGPAIREAVGHLGVDLILDGEILSWDDGKKETVPFGYNRTVAKLREQWLRAQGRLDKRDFGLHDSQEEERVLDHSIVFNEPDELCPNLAGRECWLTFVAFDVCYVGGQNAKELLQSTVAPYLRNTIEPGSVIHLDALERKKLLYRVVREVKTQVEIVFTTVVRPDGTSVDGQKYFSPTNPLTEYGHPAHLLDSITAAFNGYVTNLDELDQLRRGNSTDEEISQARSQVVHQLYTHIVKNLNLEGLLFKDLSTPYVLDNVSRALKYWHKFKPDYYNGAAASDLDLVIVGAYFATGLRHSGKPSSFLCACLDDQDNKDDCHVYPVTKVNGGSINHKQLAELLDRTGFKKGTGDSPMELGRWTRCEDGEVPQYISNSDITKEPWKPAKKERPDIWLDPNEVAVVVTLNAGEFQSSNFPLGITLRFPRIIRVRRDKTLKEIETAGGLWDIQNKVEEDKAANANVNLSHTVSTGPETKGIRANRFLTESQYKKSKSKIKKRNAATAHVQMAPKPKKVKSNAFAGLRFCCLEGTFSLKGMDLEEAKADGWMPLASSVRGRVGIQSFIKDHGGDVILNPDGKCITLGGEKNDPAVWGHIRGIEFARKKPKPSAKNPTKTSLANQMVAQDKGVLRWTFPFRLLAQWKAMQLSDADKEGKSIDEAAHELAVPDSLDYLARPCTDGFNLVQQLEGLDNVFKMRRALELVEDSTDEVMREAGDDDWYRTCHAQLGSDAWILSALGKHEESMWPSQSAAAAASSDDLRSKELVVYPDFNDTTKASMESLLPLLQVYGATIETNLSQNTTHIISDLLPGVDTVEYKRCGGDIDVGATFRDAKQGQILLDKLETALLCSADDAVVWIVSPSWIRKRCESRWVE